MKNNVLSYGSMDPCHPVDDLIRKGQSTVFAGEKCAYILGELHANQVSEHTIALITERLYKNGFTSLRAEQKELVLVLEMIEKVESLLDVERQYSSQLHHYKTLGLIAQQDGKEGIVDSQNRFYPIPTLSEVYTVLLEQMDLLEFKATQGFTQFLLVPFALDCKDMSYKLYQEYLRYAKDPMLGLCKNNGYKMNIETVREVTGYFSSKLEEEDLTYYTEPRSDGTVQNIDIGKKKSEIINNSKFPGWGIHIVSQNLSERIFVGRDLEKYISDFHGKVEGMIHKNNTRSDEVIHKGLQRSRFEGEVGLTLEVFLASAFKALREGNHMLDVIFRDQVVDRFFLRDAFMPVAMFGVRNGQNQPVVYQSMFDTYYKDHDDTKIDFRIYNISQRDQEILQMNFKTFHSVNPA